MMYDDDENDLVTGDWEAKRWRNVKGNGAGNGAGNDDVWTGIE